MTSWPGSDPQYDAGYQYEPGYQPMYPTQPMPGYPPGVPPAPQPPPPRPRRSTRLWVIAGVLAALAAASIAAVAGAGPRAVSGSGAALGSLAGPSSPPSANTHTLPPSTTSTANWVLITDEQAHLRVRMPGTPNERSESRSFAGTTFTVNLAVATDHGSPVEAASEDVSTPISSVEAKTVALRESMVSFATSSGLDKVSESATEFRGHLARTGEFRRPSGRVYTLLVFFYDDQRIYFLFAEQGTPFDTLTRSLQILA